MAEQPMQWETDKTGHKSAYESFGAGLITVVGWTLVVLIGLLAAFTMEAGFLGTLVVVIIAAIVNIFLSGFVKKLIL